MGMIPKIKASTALTMTPLVLPHYGNVAGDMHGGEAMKLMEIEPAQQQRLFDDAQIRTANMKQSKKLSENDGI